MHQSTYVWKKNKKTETRLMRQFVATTYLHLVLLSHTEGPVRLLLHRYFTSFDRFEVKTFLVVSPKGVWFDLYDHTLLQ